MTDFFNTIGMTIKEMILGNIREAGIYGLLADDVTDVPVLEQMVASVSYVNLSTSRQEVKFLFVEDVLNDREADVLLKVLTKQLDDSKLLLQNMMSIATDGASVMTGKRNG